MALTVAVLASTGLRRGRNADVAVAVEVLVEGGLERFERSVVSWHCADEVRQVVAVAVGAPHRVQAGARCHATRRRNPPATWTAPIGVQVPNSPSCHAPRRHRCNSGPVPPLVWIEKIIVADFCQRGRSVGLDDDSRESDGAVAVEVLVEGGLEGFQRRVVARDRADEIRQVVAVAVGAPDRVQAGAGVMPGDVVAAARNLHRADRRPGAKFADRYRRAAAAAIPVRCRRWYGLRK